MQHCPYCQTPVVILMLDCPNCERAYLLRTECADTNSQAIEFHLEMIQDLNECGLDSSWFFRSYAIKQYWAERQAERMNRDEFKYAITAIKSLMR